MRRAAAFIFLLSLIHLRGAETFTVGAYNLEMYIDTVAMRHEPKSEESRAKVRESIKTMAADVLALEEMGSTNALSELQGSLRKEGVDYAYSAYVHGHDTNLHVALLSRYPIKSQKEHTDDKYLLHGRRFKVTRGFGEFEIEVNANYRCTVLAAHLKSKRLMAEADESEMREQEAILLREHIDEILKNSPGSNLIVLGDLNDTKDSRSLHAIIGKGATGLIDTRPAEKAGNSSLPRGRRDNARLVTWTHYFAKEDTYSRIDYILLSKGMAREWQADGTQVVVVPDWGTASDHRPIVARFVASDR
jgi:endonuclease/exonuclease/phosphatase family metal-dependent hydrolase